MYLLWCFSLFVCFCVYLHEGLGDCAIKWLFYFTNTSDNWRKNFWKTKSKYCKYRLVYFFVFLFPFVCCMFVLFYDWFKIIIVCAAKSSILHQTVRAHWQKRRAVRTTSSQSHSQINLHDVTANPIRFCTVVIYFYFFINNLFNATWDKLVCQRLWR